MTGTLFLDAVAWSADWLSEMAVRRQRFPTGWHLGEDSTEAALSPVDQTKHITLRPLAVLISLNLGHICFCKFSDS